MLRPAYLTCRPTFSEPRCLHQHLRSNARSTYLPPPTTAALVVACQVLGGEEVLKLPDKCEETVPVILTRSEQALYKRVHAAAKEQWKVVRAAGAHTVSRNLLQIMSLLLPMRRVCSGGNLTECDISVSAGRVICSVCHGMFGMFEHRFDLQRVLATLHVCALPDALPVLSGACRPHLLLLMMLCRSSRQKSGRAPAPQRR